MHAAELLMHSFDFQRIEALQRQSRWDELAELMTDTAKKLEAYGAEAIQSRIND